MSDNVFVNIEVIGTSDLPASQLSYVENSTKPILQKSSDYNMAIVRFSLTSSLIPIFIMPILSVADQLANPPPVSSGIVAPSPNYTSYSVTLEFGGNIVQYPIVFVPTISNALLPPPNPINGEYPQDGTYYYVFTPQDMVNMVNTALAGAFNDLPVAPVNNEPPWIEYNPADDLFRLAGFAADYGSDVLPANRVNIYFSQELHEKCFTTMPFTFVNLSQGRDFLMSIPNNRENHFNPSDITPVFPPNYIFTSTASNSASRWFDLASIIFTTNTIPVVPEFQTSLTNAGDNIETPILTDFVPNLTRFGDEGSQLTFNPKASIKYRLINLISNAPLTKIDLKGFWRDRKDRLHPILLPNNSSFTMKIVFLKKDM